MNGRQYVKVGKIGFDLKYFQIPFAKKPTKQEMALMLIVEDQGVDIRDQVVYDTKKDDHVHIRTFRIHPDKRIKR
jgi:hypothetical protein